MAKSKPEKFPARHPINVGGGKFTAWFYEERGHITVVAEAYSNEGYYLATAQTKIPLRVLARTVDRYRRYKAKKRNRTT